MNNPFRNAAPPRYPLGALPEGGAAAWPDPVTAAAPPLALQVYNADGGSFHVNAVLVTGATDAVLIDTGFTRTDARRIVDLVLESGRTLQTIYVSHADPDFYFGAELLTQRFPDARLVATAPTVRRILASVQGKLDTWRPRLGADAPQVVPIPAVLPGNTILLEGQALEVQGLEGPRSARSFVWIPSLQTIVGGVNVFAGLHAWTADTQTAQARAQWLQQLQVMAALQPARVIAGHASPGAPQDAGQIASTQTYLARFETELPKAADATALVAAMQAAYPEAGLMIALEIGAKVNKGEMAW